MVRLLPVLTAFCLLGGAVAAAAQVSPDGDEMVVNVTTTGDQTAPAVAAAASGGFAVAWQSGEVDESESAALVRRGGADGVPVGGEIVANLATALDQDAPSVGMAADGGFVVAWQHAVSELDSDVRARRFGAEGFPLSAELAVHAASAAIQGEPAVAVEPGDGDFVVAWSHQVGAGDIDVRLRRFAADGTPKAGEARPHVTIASLQLAPAVSVAGDGSFVVVWQSLGQDGDGWGVYLRRFNAAGQAQGGELLVNQTVAGDQVEPRVAHAVDGRFAVVWDSFGQDGDRDGVYARLFAASGALASDEVAVNVTTSGRQSLADVAYLAAGPLVVWRSTEGDGDGSGIFARLLGADGLPNGGEEPINATTGGVQTTSAVARSGEDRAIAAWASEGLDGDGLAIVSRRLMASGGAAPCVADAETLCLQQGRFRVRAHYRTLAGAEGQAQAVALTPDTGFFWFFAAANVELVVKVLDGCAVTSRYWVFAGGLTNVEVALTVVDTTNGASRTYVNPPSTPFAPLQDTGAFAGCG